MNAKGRHTLALVLHQDTPPATKPDASITTSYGLDGSAYCNSGTLHEACFNFWKACRGGGPQTHGTSIIVR